MRRQVAESLGAKEATLEPPRAGREPRVAFYAAPGGRLKQWWTVLHPPYTAWHLSYVVIGAVLAPRPTLAPLLAALAAFFLAVGVSAHCLDELRGRPLRTEIAGRTLGAAAGASLAGAAALGLAGVSRLGWVLVPFIAAGVLLVVAYNAELLGGALHNGVVFSLAWGAFPVLTAYVAETGTLALAPCVAAAGAFALSSAQRVLSSRARLLRRSATGVQGSVELGDGSVETIDFDFLLRPVERALLALAASTVTLAAAFAIERLA